MTVTGGRRRPRRGRALLLVALLAIVGGVVLVTGGIPLAPSGSTSPEPASSAGATAVTVDNVLDQAKTNPDGSVTVSLDADETTGLVASALARAPEQPLRDVSVDVVEPEGDADGRMVVAGRLDDLSLPVEAVVDLRIVRDVVRPTVRDVRVGPVPLPSGTREDINRQVRQLALLADDQIAVEDLSTAGGSLLLTGRPR
ncbi:MAG TPA: hypothetical protein VK923_05050 [Euzebyales bacterium]|nr:hypothetical protein [Euzebyales bacterium]